MSRNKTKKTQLASVISLQCLCCVIGCFWQSDNSEFYFDNSQTKLTRIYGSRISLKWPNTPYKHYKEITEAGRIDRK